MAVYELSYKVSVAKGLRGLPKADIRRILARTEALRTNPRPAGSEKLAGSEQYRIRQGNYRILYTADDAQIIVEVVKIGHRKNIYR